MDNCKRRSNTFPMEHNIQIEKIRISCIYHRHSLDCRLNRCPLQMQSQERGDQPRNLLNLLLVAQSKQIPPSCAVHAIHSVCVHPLHFVGVLWMKSEHASSRRGPDPLVFFGHLKLRPSSGRDSLTLIVIPQNSEIAPPEFPGSTIQ